MRCLIGAVGTLALLFSFFTVTNAAAADEPMLAELVEMVAKPMAERASKWKCVPMRAFACGVDGCKAGTPSVHVVLDLEKRTYSRCDTKGCDKYPMTYSSGGAFTTFSLPYRSGTFLKTLNDGSSYVEVASSMLSVLQNFGRCDAM